MQDSFVYIMASWKRLLYIGVTTELEVRVEQHKHSLLPGFTSRYKVHRLVCFETQPNIEQAIAREKQLKRWSRAKKLALIESKNPDWSDLADPWVFGTD